MKKILTKNGFNQKDIVSFGNMFLLANGRYGYRGTLEEFDKTDMVGLNVLGLYDRYQDKWRESINLPNPLHYIPCFNGKEYKIDENNYINHHLKLDIFKATLSRYSEYDNLIISSKRFLSSVNKNLLVHRYILKAKEDGQYKIFFNVDTDIYEINGPHFRKKELKYDNGFFIFTGKTNEGKIVKTYTKYVSNETIIINKNQCYVSKRLQKGHEICVFTYSYIALGDEDAVNEINNAIVTGFEELEMEHSLNFEKKWETARVEIDDEEAQFELDYSLYHLLILEDKESYHSIPARGLSGQTYKGAVFWDTEAFILPFFTLSNPSFARNLLMYRINTLKGAKKKARSFNYQGAFYAWESQDDGTEQCSKYNVTDPITNEPLRTYFDEKQIHISADIVIAFDRYINFTGDYSILLDGGINVIYECVKFYISRATFRNNQYHFDDVMGPDEYHDGVNDNAFTNYSIYQSMNILIKYYQYTNTIKNPISLKKIKKFKDLIYLPKPNKKGIIEQFDGYFKMKDIHPEEVKNMRKNDKEYLGFIASKTKTIKQADVISLLVMLPELGFDKYFKANYDYYLPYTEHGSSLSSSMYSIMASKIDDNDVSYRLFRKSSGIDLGTDQKMYAGGIYIGGTHPASNAGAYLSVIFGFLGMRLNDDKISFDIHLPKQIKNIKFKFYLKGRLYRAYIKDDTLVYEEDDNL